MTSAIALAAGAVAMPAFGSGAAIPRCSTANLRLDFVPPVEAATGHRFWNMTLRNVAPATCHLKGFPGVGLLNSHANLMSVTVFRVTGFMQRNVVLHAWQRAWFTYSYTDGAFCPGHARSASGIQVIPPNSTSRLVYYSGQFSFCSASVYPVRPSKSPL